MCASRKNQGASWFIFGWVTQINKVSDDVLQDLILENRLLAPEGLIYVETAQAIHLEKFATRGLSIHRQGRAGQIFYGLLTHAS